MEDKLAQLFKFADQLIEEAEEHMMMLEPLYEDGNQTSIERYHEWEGYARCASAFKSKIEELNN